MWHLVLKCDGCNAALDQGDDVVQSPSGLNRSTSSMTAIARKRGWQEHTNFSRPIITHWSCPACQERRKVQ